MRNLFFPLICFLIVLNGCAKAPGKTSAKMKLTLSGIVNLSSGIGSGGALLFGRSSAGEMFGKVVVGTEENLDIPNGDWSFYALMWDTSISGFPMNDKVHCAKTLAKLSGTDITLNFNLTNANCTDPEFSNGRFYDAGGMFRFADIFVEECDDIAASNSWFCGADNQGSALSYRLKFQSFKKGPATPFLFGAEAITSRCVKVDKTGLTSNVLTAGLPVNFPSGNGTTPFVASIEMFLGSDTCDTTEAKGQHTISLNGGLGMAAGIGAKIVESTTACDPNTLSYPAGTLEQQNLCDAYLGGWNVSSCMPSSILNFITRFSPAAACGTRTPSSPAIKHMVAIPKSRLCDPHLGRSYQIGSHPFAGGNGTSERPYKICNEWQMNQIGEAGSPDGYRLAHFKLMNDLDMNKTDFGPYAKPNCVGSSTMLEKHHNLNPIVALESSCGTANDLTSNNGFQGIFNGNNKTISNGRISVEGIDANYVGFIRKLWGGAILKNLNFKNLEVRGRESVGGVAGTVAGPDARIMNILIDGLDVEGKQVSGSGGTMIGGVVGNHGNGSFIENVKVVNSEVNGYGTIGGIVGQNYGIISKTGFSGIIDHDYMSGNYIGGIAGKSDGGGTIELSYSKGLISANAQYVGGIVSNMSTGSLHSVYSTMSIISRFQTADAFIGGIAGYASTNITDAFFDGKINNTGAASVNIFGVGSITGTKTNCYSTGITPAPSGCLLPSYTQARDHSITTFATSANWIKTSGLIPRLVWENNTCANSANLTSVSAQVAAGRGTLLLNPVIICTGEQLESLAGRSSTEFYRLAEDINLSGWTASSAALTGSFNGTLLGSENAIYGLNVTMTSNATANYVGIFGTNNGTIKNLKLFNNILTSVPEETSTGILTGINKGKISSIESFGNEITGYNNIGGLVGRNGITGAPGDINKVHLGSGKINGMVGVGGIAGVNDRGSITRASSKVKITNTTTGDFAAIGGIVGANSAATLDQISFGGEIILNSVSSNTEVRVGGIAGSNFGTISNALVDNYAYIELMNHTKVGGLVGANSSAGSVLEKSIALGRVRINNSNAPLSGVNVSQLAGFNLGTVSDSYFLGKNLGAFISTSTVDAANGCNTANELFFSTLVTGLSFGSTDTDLMLPAFQPGGGNGLKTMTIMPSPTADQIVPYTGVCNLGEQWNFYKSWEPSAAEKLTVAQFGAPSTFAAFDMAYDTGDPTTSRNTARMYEYFLSEMENRLPTLIPPVWEHDNGDGHPRLLQLDH